MIKEDIMAMKGKLLIGLVALIAGLGGLGRLRWSITYLWEKNCR
jgi:hypothetical protein